MPFFLQRMLKGVTPLFGGGLSWVPPVLLVSQKISGIISLGTTKERVPRTMARDYKSEYRNYHSRSDQKKNRASRNSARAAMESAGRVKKGDGKDVTHRDGNPRNNGKKNLGVLSAKSNRSYRRTKTAGKAEVK